MYEATQKSQFSIIMGGGGYKLAPEIIDPILKFTQTTSLVHMSRDRLECLLISCTHFAI